MNHFAEATRLNLTFNINGVKTIDQLWKLSKDTLATYGQELENSLHTKNESRFGTVRTKEDTYNEIRLAIVEHIYNYKKDLERAAAEKHNAADELYKIEMEKERRKAQSISTISDEELEKRANELRGKLK